MFKYELDARHDSRKSFYGKANVEEADDGTKTLISYSTVVARIIKGKLEIYGFYSPTTLRHIKEFAQQNGYPAMSKKELEEFEVE